MPCRITMLFSDGYELETQIGDTVSEKPVVTINLVDHTLGY